MPFSPQPSYQRRQILRLATLAAGASLFPSACRTLNSTSMSDSVTAQPSVPPQTSRVVLVHSEDRVAGTRQALDLLQPSVLK
jgi:hypothetical protein